jgi:hypothetical protein
MLGSFSSSAGGRGRAARGLDSAGAPSGWGVKDLTAEFYCQTMGAVRKSPERGSCGNAGATARASDANFRASRGLTQPDRNQWLSRIEEFARLLRIRCGHSRNELFANLQKPSKVRSKASTLLLSSRVTKMTHLTIGTYAAKRMPIGFYEWCRSDRLCGSSHKVPVSVRRPPYEKCPRASPGRASCFFAAFGL